MKYLIAVLLIVAYFSPDSVCTAPDDPQEPTTTEYPEKASDTESRIAGGSEAKPNQFPYHVSIKAATVFMTSCGGSLISDSYVLTAAHCLFGKYYAIILLGTINIAAPSEGHIEQTVFNSNFIIHAKYDSDKLPYDIGLVKLDELVPFSVNIQPINLPRLSDIDKDFAGATAVATGWGRSETDKPYILRFANLTVITNSECEDWYADVPTSNLCTLDTTLTRICTGDSGGPLALRESDGTLTLIGVSSFGMPDCSMVSPSGFNRVTFYLDWIGNNTDIKLKP